MAQYDTELGWSAEDNYLVQTAGATIASLSSAPHWNISGYETQIIPVTPETAADVVAGGLLAFEYVQNRAPYKWYYAANKEGALVAYFFDGTPNNIKILVIVPDDSYRVYFQRTEGGYLQGSITVYNTFSTTTVGSDTVHYFYTTWTGLRPDAGYQLHIPTFPNQSNAQACVETAWANIVPGGESQFTKDNSGYSVACLVKWKTTNGTELISPILISSDTEFVDMTSTGSFNLAKFNKLLSGVRFYMAFWDIPGTNSLSSLFPEIDLTSRGNIDLEQLFMTIISTSYAHVIIINSPDPYEEEGGDSGEEGGDGEELEDDEMGISHHAIPAAINTGFCRIYCPSAQQLRDLSNFLWSAQYDLTAVKKLFANPMDSVLGLSAVPLNLSGANSAVYLGGVDTEMSFPMVSYQSYQVPMGAITVDKRWGSYLDYDPYTKFSIYLPFIGFKDLSADDIMGRQIILDYDVDILSGACTARLQAGANVLYQWSGQCSIQLPVTASNWNQVFQSATSAALSAGLAVATGTAGPVLAGALAAEGAQAIMGKPRIERGGSSSGAAGWMGGLTPYLVRVTPEAIIPNDQNKFIGYPAFSSISLGALTGYNEISSIHLEGIPATGAELDELEAILKGGVIF